MSLKIRFRFYGRCTRHPRYDPKRDGHPSNGKCEGCESLYVIHLYTKIAKKELKTRTSSWPELPAILKKKHSIDAQTSSETGAES